MKIGIIEAGLPPEELQDEHGSYPEMFARMLAGADPSFSFRFVPALDGTAYPPPQSCDGWLVSGSKHSVYEPLDWIGTLKDFARSVYDAGIPIVGICFGHQLLAEALGGRVARSDKGWSCGVHSCKVMKTPEWMTPPLPEYAILDYHQDRVVEVPESATPLAASNYCAHAALVYDGTAISFQGHPEMDGGFARKLFESRRGNSLPETIADQAMASTGNPVDAPVIARWIANFYAQNRSRQAAYS